jgi:pyridoxal phosphate enzyme (YggS family)
MASAARASGREPGAVDLIAVSKTRSDASVLAAYDEGQRQFGENRQQGLASRIESDLPADIEWHFIGPLQSRKAPFVAAHASLLHSFDRLTLIKRWAGSATPVLLQFNLGDEPQKGGFHPDEAERVLTDVLAAGVAVRGVMAIPPMAEDPEYSRPHFVRLRQILDDLRRVDPALDILSMGMSNDYEVAIAEGATMVRVGTAIFGALEHP